MDKNIQIKDILGRIKILEIDKIITEVKVHLERKPRTIPTHVTIEFDVVLDEGN